MEDENGRIIITDIGEVIERLLCNGFDFKIINEHTITFKSFQYREQAEDSVLGAHYVGYQKEYIFKEEWIMVADIINDAFTTYRSLVKDYLHKILEASL